MILYPATMTSIPFSFNTLAITSIFSAGHFFKPGAGVKPVQRINHHLPGFQLIYHIIPCCQLLFRCIVYLLSTYGSCEKQRLPGVNPLRTASTGTKSVQGIACSGIVYEPERFFNGRVNLHDSQICHHQPFHYTFLSRFAELDNTQTFVPGLHLFLRAGILNDP